MRTIKAVMLLLFVWCLLIGVNAFAGSQYTTTGGYSLMNNIGNCGVNNCFSLATNKNAVGGTFALLSQITSGADGYTLAVDPNGAVWYLPQTTGTAVAAWTQLPAMGTVKALAVRSADEIYSLKTDTQCANGFEANRWTGSAWVKMHHCFGSSIAVGTDDTFGGINVNGSISFTSDPQDTNPVWSLFPGTTHYKNFTVYTLRAAFALINGGTTDGYIQEFDLQNSLVQGWTGATVSTDVKATADGYVFELAKVAGPKGPVYYNKLQNPPGTAFTNINSVGVTSLGGFNSNSFFGLKGQTPYHFQATTLSYTTTITGHWDCSPQPCPTGSMHTASTNVAFPGHTAKTGSSNPAPPATNITAASSDAAVDCDPLYGDPNSQLCIVQIANGNVDCSEMGAIVNQDGGGGSSWMPQINEELAFTRTLWNGNTPHDCHQGTFTGLNFCLYDVINYCAPFTDPPDNDYTGRSVSDVGASSGWDTLNPCWRLYNGAPIVCTKSFAWKTSSAVGAAQCTRNWR